MRLTVATFNIRNDTDRYEERRPLLAAAFAALAADVAGLQEVRIAGERQDDLLMAAAPGHAYRSFAVAYPRYPGYGIAALVATGDVLAHEQIELGHGRIAQRLLIALPGGRTAWFANTHLHHRPADREVREAQAKTLCEWLREAPAATATVVVGDFNAPPFEPAYAVMLEHGYASAFRAVHGIEPGVTWPSGIQAPTMDTDGDPNCLDYIWVAGAARAVCARLAANEPAPGDPTLYPSDHFAIVATVEL